MSTRISRRQALSYGAALAAGTSVGCASGPEGTAPEAEEQAEALQGDRRVVRGRRRHPRGYVVEVRHPGAVVGGIVQDTPVRRMMARGMQLLSGEAEEAAAWRAFFAPGDRVGIKVNPTGYPQVISQIETVAAIVRGLNLAGVPNSKIVVFDRYQDSLDLVGYPAKLPPGLRYAFAAPAYTTEQTGTEGYDPSAFVDLPRVYPGDDATDPRKRRSSLCRVVSEQVDKVVNVPTLKDHTSAGITMALKNMTYGLVNNVARTHAAPDNWTRDFVPAIASMPMLRRKVVLHIADALVGCYDGGPSPDHPNFSPFTYGALMFAVDPVAMDRIGWKILDAKRKTMGLPPLDQCGRLLVDTGYEPFDRRQPDHVLTAGAAGLGIADLARIRHRVVSLT
jgi:uncharacterized protein (DUF362 family)